MDYKLVSPKLQDLVTRAETIVAAASELGTISSGNLLIPAADIKSGLVAGDVIHAKNETLGELLTPTISGANLSLDGSSAITAGHVITVIVKVA
jgi:hypothetical protein